jgi:hydroxymethylpyrimidine pyrophosphatase-like HAD family hydrolase
VIYSAGKFLDVLPKGVNKGSTLLKLVQHLKVNTEDVLVAGDTLNDLAMYHCGFKGVVVGNAEPQLLDATLDIPNVYQAHRAGAGGILEALKQFDNFSHYCNGLGNPAIQQELQETPQLLLRLLQVLPQLSLGL